MLLGSLAAGYGLSVVRATHADPAVVHLCVSNYTTQIRYVTNPAQCSDGYVIDLNQQGLPGSQGPAGPQGSAGPAGPPGSAGVDGQPELSDFVIRTGTVTFAVNFTSFFQVHCLPGEVATGGGYSGPIEAVLSHPNTTPPSNPPSTGDLPTSWTVLGYNGQGVPVDVTGYVVCMAT